MIPSTYNPIIPIPIYAHWILAFAIGLLLCVNFAWFNPKHRGITMVIVNMCFILLYYAVWQDIFQESISHKQYIDSFGQMLQLAPTVVSCVAIIINVYVNYGEHEKNTDEHMGGEK